MKIKILYSLTSIILMSTSILSDNLVGVLTLKDKNTEDVIINGRKFEGDDITSLVIAKKDFFSDSLGMYLSAGGTLGRTERDRKQDEKNSKFINTHKYRLYNIGLTYTPISNITLLGGGGYGESKGEYYTSKAQRRLNKQIVYVSQYQQEEERKNSIPFRVNTKKKKGINYNVGLNLSYGFLGIIAMYDSFPKTVSIGLSYNFGAVPNHRKKYKHRDRVYTASKPIRYTPQTQTNMVQRNSRPSYEKSNANECIARCLFKAFGTEMCGAGIDKIAKERLGIKAYNFITSPSCEIMVSKLMGEEASMGDIAMSVVTSVLDDSDNKDLNNLSLGIKATSLGSCIYDCN